MGQHAADVVDVEERRLAAVVGEAGLLAGLLWDAVGPEATFLGGALLALFALAWLRLQR